MAVVLRYHRMSWKEQGRNAYYIQDFGTRRQHVLLLGRVQIRALAVHQHVVGVCQTETWRVGDESSC